MAVSVRLSPRPSRFGLFAALLALAAQLAFAASVPQPVTLLLGLGAICHADRTGPAPGHPPRPGPPGARSPRGRARAMPVPPRAAAPPLPAPRRAEARIAVILPPSTAPPPPFALAAAPRGPPVALA